MYDCDALDCVQHVPKFSISQIHQRVDTSQNYLIVIALTFVLNVNIVQKESAVCNVSEDHSGNASSSCVKFPSGANADTNQFWFCVQHFVRSKKPKREFLVLVKKGRCFRRYLEIAAVICFAASGCTLICFTCISTLTVHNCAVRAKSQKNSTALQFPIQP